CEIEVFSDTPLPVIKGGTERTVESGRGFLVDGSKSVDRNVPPNQPGNLNYRWTCEVIQGKIKDFCEGGSYIEVPAKYAIKNYQYRFHLFVSADPFNTTSTQQTVTILDNVVELEIICEKNCPPVASITDNKRVTFLRSKCLENCKGVFETSYEWTVEDVANFNYQESTQFGRNTDKFVIKAGVLQPGNKYRIRLGLTGGRIGTAVKIIETHTPPKIESCEVKPSQGRAIITKFKIDCKYTGSTISFEIYTSKGDINIQIARSVELSDLEFMLPINTKVFIRIVDLDGSFVDHQLNVNAMIKKKKIEDAIQIANGIIEEIDKKKLGKITKKTIIETLEEYPINSQEDAKQIASLVNRLVHDPNTDSDPYQGAIATKVCKEAANVSLEQLSKEYSPTTLTSETKEMAETLMSCGESDSKPNFEILQATPLPIITTPFPLLSLPVIEEDYPDYVADDTVMDKTKKYEEVSENVVSICRSNLKMMAMTIVEGEETMTISTQLCSVEVTKLVGSKLVDSKIGAQGVTIFPSGDMEKVNNPVDVMVCSWSNDPFWWNLQRLVVATNVILLKMSENGTDLVMFKQPNRIAFDLYDVHLQKQINVLEVSDSNMSVIRIEVREGEAFFVEFHKLTDSDEFRVMVTDFSKPDFDEVQNKGQIVNKKRSLLYQEHEHGYDSWYYVSVLPNAGSSNSTQKKLECYCNHLSILAGIIHNNYIKIDKVLYEPDFEMVLIYCPIIFVSVCVVFGIYCIALSFTVTRREIAGKNIFLPADISSSSLFIYLIRIRTGKRPLSGTSSNICIKIFGEKRNSRSHVLNYPDPHKRIFQWGNIDWFILPTRHHLGKLLEVALWSDHSGRNPCWFCSDLTIYDLQTNQRWWFKLNIWFNLPPNGQIYTTATVSEKQNKERAIKNVLSRACPRRFHQAGFSSLKKLSLLLSIVMVISMSGLVMYGLPTLKPSDGFAWVNEYGLHLHKFSLRVSRFCWLFLVFTVLLSMTLLLIFGFWIPTITGWLWLTSVIIALVVYFFILENLYEKISNIFYQTEENVKWFSKLRTVLLLIEAQRRHLFKKFGEDLLRPYFTHLYQPMNEEDIRVALSSEKKVKETSRLKLMALLEDTIINTHTVKGNREILDLLEGLHTRTHDTSIINSIDGFYDYINLTLILNLQSKQWYWRYVVNEPGMTVDFHNKYLGVARLRQQRVMTHSCKIPVIMESFFKNETCRSEFWTSKRSVASFGPEYNNFSRLSHVWNYTRATLSAVSITVGKFGAYSGSGYIAPLGRTMYNSFINLNYLREHHWLDATTSVVFVEFLTYNVNSNLFSAVRIMVERSVSGYFRVKVNVKTTQLLFIKDELRIAQFVIFGSFILIVFVFTMKILRRLWKGKLFFLKDLWILVDLVIVGMSYGCFVLYIHRAELVKTFLETMRKAKKNEFVNYFNMFHEDLSFHLVAAFLVFVSTIRLWKLCRFATVFKIMEKTIVLSLYSILIILLGYAIFMTAFTIFAHMLFGSLFGGFKDIRDTLVTLFLQSMGLNKQFDATVLIDTYPLLWGMFYSVFMIMNLLFFTVYIAIMVICHYEAQKLDSGEDDFNNFKKFLFKELIYYKTLAKVTAARLSGGANSKKPKHYVTAKHDDIRYAKCLLLDVNKISMMSCIAAYSLRMESLSEEEKFSLMTRIGQCSRDSDKTDFFFGEKSERNKTTIVYDGRLKKMAAVVEWILKGDEKKARYMKLKYNREVDRQLKKLDFIEQMLTCMLHIINNIESNCPYDEIYYQWSIRDLNENVEVLKGPRSTSNAFVLQPFVVNCSFSVQPALPIPVIQGGNERMVKAGVSFRVDGSKSIDADVPPDQPGNLMFTWSCVLMKGHVEDFCLKKLKEESIIEVPAKYAVKDHTYFFTLDVKTPYYVSPVSAEQTIQVLENAVELEIICEKNCLPVAPKTDSERLTFLRVICLSSCEGVNENSYQWTVEGENDFNYEKSTQFGRYTDKFVIKSGVLQPRKEYKIRVYLIGEYVGEASKTLEPYAPPIIESCQVKPPQGKAIETKFKVRCVYSAEPGSSFEIFTSKDQKNVQITKSRSMEDLEFVLPINTEVYLRIVDPDGSYIIQQLIVDAVQIANGIIEEIDKKPIDLASKVKKTILESFKGYPIKSQEDARQIASMVTRLVQSTNAESDPYQGELATKLCMEAAKVDLEHFKKKQYPTILSKEAEESTKTLMSCGEIDSKANFDMLKPTPLPIDLITPFPLLHVPVVHEDYPDYVADETVLEKTKKYEETSKNFVSICQTNLQMMALTLVEGEDTMIVATDHSSVEVTRSIGSKLVGRTIKVKGAAVRPSGDLNRVNDPVNILICTWSKDPFWWNHSGRVAITNVMLLKMEQGEKELVSFKQPNRVILKLHKRQGEVKIHEIKDVNMSIVRIDVKKGEAFFVEFYNLTDVDSFRVMVTDFTKVDLEEVQKKGEIVKKGQSVLYREHNHDYDGWHYVSILPDRAPTEFKFWISAYSMSCYSWNISQKEWEFACKGRFNSSQNQLECFCNHLSILAGMVRNNLIKVDSVLFDPNFEMILFRCPIVFICVCVVFGIYCLTLSLTATSKEVTGRNIFLPADVSSSCLYILLIRIRTGRRPLSGTSSNICIKIFGDRRKSRSHVLNYPDPYKRIFQWGNKDWFVLPTQYHLGNLTEIALWSDHSGRNPSWFCSDVTIYDLQTGQKWFFKLNTWFNLPPNGKIHTTATATEDRNEERVIRNVLSRICPRRSHQAGFTNFKKLTLLLSIVITNFFYILVMYGLPKLEMRDCFSTVNHYELYYHVILISLASALIASTIHIPLMWLFKKSGSVNFFCWVFLVFNVSLSMTVLLIFGFWIPTVIGWLWLTSTIIALMVYFFILENLYEKIWNILQKAEEDTQLFLKMRSILMAIEIQRKYLFKKFGEDLLRPYFTHLYRPMDNTDIKERKLKEETRLQLLALLEDTILFFCYITLLYLAIFANKNPLSVLSNQGMLDLIAGIYNRTKDITIIKSIDSFYDYINLSLIINLQANQWYWKYVVNEPGIMVDFNNKYLGVARLRQQRALAHPCNTPTTVDFLIKNDTCRSEFWTSKHYTGFFGDEYNLSRLSQVWNYTKAEKAGISLVVGKFGVYYGGGYIAPLGRTKYNSYINLDYLRKNHWLDSATSVIFVEFLAYNVNSNLFNGVRITVENSATGYFRVKVDAKTAQLLFIKDEDETAELVIFFTFFLMVFIFTVKVLSRLWKKKWFFVKDLWILIDLLIVGMSYGCFALFIHRANLVKNFLEKLDKAKKNEFVNYFNVFSEDLVFILVAAFLVFISTVRLWKMCRFATVFKIMEKSLVLSISSIVIIALNHAIVLTAFSCCAYMMFGGFNEHFKDVRDTLVTLFLLSIHNYKINKRRLLETFPVLWVGLYGSFMILSLLFFTIYISNIIISYHEAHQLVSSNENDFINLKKFTIKEFAYYKRLAKVAIVRLTGGADPKKRRRYVVAKPNENRYANCMTIGANKIERMRCLVVYTLKKDSLSNEEKFKLMQRILRYSNESGGIEIFFNKKNEFNIMKIIHDNTLRKIARTVQLLLSWDNKKRRHVEIKYRK
ncbi:polycystin-2-like, partial [Asbolus verrucosus]